MCQLTPNMDCNPAFMTRTQRYKKITKPLLERKRRARINRCLDELKELMVNAFQGENVNKLEKADILELTVRHLHTIINRTPTNDEHKYHEGFQQCISEVWSFLVKLPGFEHTTGQKLVEYLSQRNCGPPLPPPAPVPAPVAVPRAASALDPPRPRPEQHPPSEDGVWRPW